MNTSIIDWLESIWKTDLPSNSKYIASYLRTYMNAKRDLCWPAVGTIARETGLSQNTVRTHIKILESNGWLAVDRTEGGFKGETNRYLALIPDSFLQDNEFEPLQPLNPTPATVEPLPLQQLKTNKQLNKQENKQINNIISDSDRDLALNYWQSKGVFFDVGEQWILFTAHHESKPNKKIKNYSAAWRTWYVNAVRFNKNNNKKEGDAFSRLSDKSWADGII